MPLPLATLITDRLARLGLNTHALAARLGYVNTNKGHRRLASMMEGRLAGQAELLSRLAAALHVSPEEVTDAVRATAVAKEQGRREAEATEERRYRTSFVPHAVIVTERQVPSQITLCAVTRGEAALRITLDTTRPRASFACQTLTELNHRTEGGRREIVFFGAARGFIVNYDWCRAVRFDVDGRGLELLSRAIRVGESRWPVR